MRNSSKKDPLRVFFDGGLSGDRCGFFLAAAGSRLDFAGFVNDAGELFDNTFTGEFLWFFEINERDVGATEEFFHVLRVAAGVIVIGFCAIFEFDGADGAQGTFVAEDEVDGLVLDETVGGVAILEADFVAEERRKVDAGDNVEFFAEEVVEHLKALLLGADHEVLARAVAAAIHGFFVAAAGSNAGEDGDQKQQ